jgi:two-component system alkaline phosphatase synthesis response regulator PhoP
VDHKVDFVRQLSSLLKTEEHEVLTALEITNLPDLVRGVGAHLVVYEPLLLGFDIGLEQCQQLRTQEEALLLIISQAARLEDKLGAFAAGADDYLVKPFDVHELYMRILALLRRYPYARKSCLPHLVRVTPEIRLDLHRQIITVKGREVNLRPLEFKLLAHFVQHPNIVLSREQLLEAVWGYDYLGNTREVDTYVHHLRQKIEPDPSEPQYIRTVWGTGYTFSFDCNGYGN